ncbi:hypothetical protein FRC09_012423 [Ceratobasidium sp. 395]|nr:hypothetical protein FRC09_012423 [Ceratobasidium sp. 395]
MENSRRFVPSQKNTAPSTPNVTRRVLPTPPATEAPAFRLAPAGNAVDSSLQSDARPSTAIQGKEKPKTAPKLNIQRLKQNKAQKNGLHADNNRATRSPPRPSKPLPQAHAHNPNIQGTQDTHVTSIFGRQNGLLPLLTRQSSPLSPGLMAPPAQPTNSRFSSPASSIAETDGINNTENKSSGAPQADLSNSEAHTSMLNPFAQPRAVVAPHAPHQHQQSLHPRLTSHLATPRTLNHEGDFDELEAGSPSPTGFSKRRAEDHHTHGPTKRLRPHYESGANDYPSQEQVNHEPPVTNESQPLSQTVFSSSLDAYIGAHHDEWLAAQKRWENCTMDEWKNGPAELVAEFSKVMDMVKDFMMQVPVPVFFLSIA